MRPEYCQRAYGTACINEAEDCGETRHGIASRVGPDGPHLGETVTSKQPSTDAPADRSAQRVPVGTTARPKAAAATHRWLLLVHQVPAKPSNLRVRTWRRLQQIGAIAVKQAVYVLPDSPSAREDFEWLRAEIEAGGGDASVFAAETLDAWTNDELVGEFRRAREGDYITLSRAIERALEEARRKRAPRRSRRSATRMVDAFRQRLAAMEAIDFFGSAGRDRVVGAIAELRQTLSGERSVERAASASDSSKRDSFRRRLWVTRPRPGIDRIGSAWLIKRFIDSEARFSFVERAPTMGDAIPFDMFGVEFSHRGEWCTFETLAQTFTISDSAVERLAAIVHDLDLKDGKFGAPEAGTVGALVDGLQSSYQDDHLLLDNGITMFEALYRSFERASRPSGPRPVANRTPTRGSRGRRRR